MAPQATQSACSVHAQQSQDGEQGNGWKQQAKLVGQRTLLSAPARRRVRGSGLAQHGSCLAVSPVRWAGLSAEHRRDLSLTGAQVHSKGLNLQAVLAILTTAGTTGEPGRQEGQWRASAARQAATPTLAHHSAASALQPSARRSAVSAPPLRPSGLLSRPTALRVFDREASQPQPAESNCRRAAGAAHPAQRGQQAVARQPWRPRCACAWAPAASPAPPLRQPGLPWRRRRSRGLWAGRWAGP